MRAALCLLLLAAVGALAFVVKPEDRSAFLDFQNWRKTYHKEYANENEMALRFENFKASQVRVAARQAHATRTVWGLTQFADLSVSEFKAKYLNFKPPRNPPMLEIPTIKRSGQAAPSSFDWHLKGMTTYVKDQEQCGSCWAFSIVENIESMWAIAGQKLEEFSEQQVVDCDKVDQGCQGGFPDTAYQYIVNATGLETEKNYPYHAVDGKCKFDKSKVAVSLDGFAYAIPPCTDSCRKQNEELMRDQLAAIGPFSVCVYAEPWQDYMEGDCCDDLCPADYETLDHCVQLTGYVWPNHWIARNSWGASWGQQGYIHLYTGSNMCGIADWVTYAKVHKPAH